MASNTNREVNLSLGVTTTGGDAVQGLAKDFKALAATSADVEQLGQEVAALSAKTSDLRQTETAAKKALDDQRAAIADQRDALAKLRLTTDDAAKSEDSYRTAVKAAQLALIDARAELRSKQAASESAATASRVAAAAEAQAKQQLDAAAASYRATGAAATAGGQQQKAAAETATVGLEEMGAALRTISNLAAGVLGGQLLAGTIGQVAATADAFNNLQARVKLATGEGAGFAAAMSEIEAISQRTGTSLDTTAGLFGKVSAATKALGVDTAGALRLTAAITQAIALSGESAEASNAAVVQFAQGLQAGVLRGEDLNSVLEQAPRLAKALADGLGVTTGSLKAMGEAGSLSASQVVAALQGQAGALQSEFAQLPTTIGRAITNLSSSWEVYVGQVDKSTGASATAASAIDLLAKNLDTVAAVLIGAGKAATAWGAIKLAEGFIARATAAASATAAIEANTVALKSNGVAAEGAAASAGRFASLIGGLKVAGLLTVLTNLREIGTALGEGAAKLMGYDKPLRELEIETKADAEAARLAAAERAAHAQALQLASDKALGLTDASKLLITEFDKSAKSGDSVADSLGKVAKNMDLTSGLKGIADAGAALDALAVKGKASAADITAAFGEGLKGVDLGVFAAQAAAAFDSSEQGARRLKVALDAVANESLRRAGTSVDELKTGFSAASLSAINDVDTLDASLKKMGITGADASAALVKSLDQATAAATTSRAVQAVIDRWTDLGKQGAITGDALAAGLDKAKTKLESLTPGVNSLAEAMHTLGLKSQEDLQGVADKSASAWQVVSTTAGVGAKALADAFQRYHDDAVAANGGIESSTLASQRQMLEWRVAAMAGGDAIVANMERAGGAVDQLGNKASSASDKLAAIMKAQDNTGKGPAGVKQAPIKSNVGRKDNGDGTVTYNLPGAAATTDEALADLTKKKAAGTLSADDLAEAQNLLAAAKQNTQALNWANSKGAGIMGDTATEQRAAQAIVDKINDLISAKTYADQQASAKAAKAGASASTSHTVTVNLNGTSTTVNAASAADASSLSALVKQLAVAKGTAA